MARTLTVLMAVHNGDSYLGTAIESILNQTYQDFDFLIIDDASTDDTRKTVRAYNDPRIRLICLDRNIGQTAALNEGVRQISTPWIARMDADDFSAPTRLEEQMKTLDANRSLSCVGTFAWTFKEDPHQVERTIDLPVDFAEIKLALLAQWPLLHGCLVVSREALVAVGAYNERYRYCADIDFYDRLLDKYLAANVPKYLLGLRQHQGQGSRSKVAIDENIEISHRRLSAKTYSAAEISILRANLAHLLIVRARYFGGNWQQFRLFKDLWLALRASPKKFPWYSFKIFIIYLVGEGSRAKLRALLPRVAARFRV